MVAAGHQTWERGDSCALSFDDAKRRSGLDLRPYRGDARACRSGTDPTPTLRGLSWSDFAVLFRSVAKDAGPLVEELRKRGIPYVVKGLNRLFDSR